jgi:DNA-binding CsgD family transcriptional regulator/N-acetylneuraminic acid mutarotase
MTEINSLSDREKEVLQYVAAGLTNREIAQKLIISPNTVKVHLSNIFEKINVASRTEATVYAIEHRIVDVPGGENGTSGQQTGALSFLRQVKWYWLVIGVLLLVVLIAILTRTLFPTPTPPTIATADIAERWKELSPMPEARQGMAAVAFDGNIYTLAGKGPDGVSGSVFRYLPEEDRWETLNEKPTPVKDVEGVVIGEKIYVPGGETADGMPTNILEVYDPRQDTWETGAPLPQALSAYALADFEGKMYLFGGWDGEGAVDTVYEYNVQNGSWKERTHMNNPSYDLGAVALEDKIVVLGGRKGKAILDQAWAYYPSRDASGEAPWESFMDLPEGRAGFGAASIYNSIYLLGGETPRRVESGLIITANKWITLPVDRDFSERKVKLVSLDSLLVVLDPENTFKETRLWRYEAFYYSIYIPFMP